MRRDVSTILVGALVLGALALGTGALVLVGSVDLFSRSSRVVVFIDESVSGLAEGAAVKLRGVGVGQVASLEVVCDLEGTQTVVAVSCSIRPGVIADHSGRTVDMGDGKTLDELIEKGLRAKVALTGMTGLRYLDLDFYDPDKHPARYPRGLDGAVDSSLVVPAIPSTISELTHSVAEILSELRHADISETTAKFSDALDASTKTLESLRELSGRVARVLSELENAGVGDVIQRLSTTLVEAEASLRSVTEASRQIAWLAGGESGLDRTFVRTFEAIAGAARAVERLAEYLERHPDALLVGKPHE